MPRTSASSSTPSAYPFLSRFPRSPLLTAFLLAILCFAVRIPLLTNAVPLPPDGHEYLNVAWNLAHGHGFRKTIKWNYYRPQPVIHSALAARPILYSIVLTPLVAYTPEKWLSLTLRLFSALLCMGTVIFAYLLWRRLFPPGVALAAGLILAVQPGFMDIGTLPLTEPLLLFLMALTFYTASRARTWWAWGVVGLLVGLGYLTRPNGIFLLPIFLGYLLLPRKGHGGAKEPGSEGVGELDGENPLNESEKRSAYYESAENPPPPTSSLPHSPVLSLLGLIAGFLIAVMPFWIANARINGSAFASDLQLAYAVVSVKDATWNGFGRTFTRPLPFILSHFRIIMREMYNQTWIMLPTFANSLPFLSTFVLFLRRKHWTGLSGVMLAFGTLNLLFYCVSWNVTGAVRYLLPTTFCFIAPLLAVAFSLELPSLRLGKIRIPAMVLLLTLMLAWFQPSWNRTYGYRADEVRDMKRDSMYRDGAAWLRSQNPSPDTVVASNNPWLVDYLTHLPSAVCPSFDRPERVREFVKEYHVRYIVLFGRRNVGSREDALQAAGLGRFVSPAPKVRIWEFSPDLWASGAPPKP